MTVATYGSSFVQLPENNCKDKCTHLTLSRERSSIGSSRHLTAPLLSQRCSKSRRSNLKLCVHLPTKLWSEWMMECMEHRQLAWRSFNSHQSTCMIQINVLRFMPGCLSLLMKKISRISSIKKSTVFALRQLS